MAPGFVGGRVGINDMHDELPEPLNRVSRPSAIRELRQRTLSAVNHQLAVRRKPRWERVLELSVAATFVLGVGLNAGLIRSSLGLVVSEGHPYGDARQDPLVAQDDTSERQLPESLEASYARYLAQLSAKPAG